MHLDSAFNWCKKDFGLIGIGCNSMGAHNNPVSLIILNGETVNVINSAWDTTIMSMYSLFKSVQLCVREDCCFCKQLCEQNQRSIQKFAAIR
jgi:hypothetical protein